MKKIFSFGLVFLFSVIALGACNTAAPTAVPTGTEAVATTEQVTTAPTAIPTPSADETLLTGVLAKKGSGGDPDMMYADVRMYLGVLLTSTDGKTTVARVNEKTAPQTRTDENGRFVFKGIDPGKYILVVQVPPNNLLMLKNHVTGKDLIIDVEKGKIADVGVMYQDLPFEGFKP